MEPIRQEFPCRLLITAAWNQQMAIRKEIGIWGVWEGGFQPCVFILREIYKTLCFRIQGLTCTTPHPNPQPPFSPSPILFKPLIKRTSGLHWGLQRERGLIAVKQTTRWCHFSLITMLPIAVTFIFLSKDTETTGWGHDSDHGHLAGRQRKHADATWQRLITFTQEAQWPNYQRWKVTKCIYSNTCALEVLELSISIFPIPTSAPFWQL